MKPYITVLLLIITLPIVLQAASDYTITNKHRVIQEVSISQNEVPIGTELPRLNFTTLSGDIYTLETLTGKGPVVAVFLATRCPVAQRYTMRLKRLHTEFTTNDKHTTFVGIYANEEDTLDDVKAYVQKAEYSFPIVKDTTGYLAELLGATMTPQAMIIDTSGTLRYRGPIDDNRYENRVKHNYLHDALLATHTGDAIPLQETPAFGCTIHLPESSLPSEVTYSEHIATILQNNCQTCHRHGEVAPFTLTKLRRREGVGNRDRCLHAIASHATLETRTRIWTFQERTTTHRWPDRINRTLGRRRRASGRPQRPTNRTGIS